MIAALVAVGMVSACLAVISAIVGPERLTFALMVVAGFSGFMAAIIVGGGLT